MRRKKLTLNVSTRSVIELLEEEGIDVSPLLDKVGLTRQVVFKEGGYLPTDCVLEFGELARQISHDPLLHLHADQRIPLGAYQALEYVIATSETLGEGFKKLAEFIHLANTSTLMKIQERSDHYSIQLEYHERQDLIPPTLVEYIFCSSSKRIQSMIDNWAPASIHFRHRPRAPIEEYEKIMNAKVKFEQNINEIVVLKSDWTRKMKRADSNLGTILVQYLTNLSNTLPRDEDMIYEIHQYLAKELPGGAPKIEIIAKHLGLETRTLQRHLKAKGTSFKKILEDTREELAKIHLADMALSINEISYLLGYSEQSVFQRAFQRQTGKTPGVYRRQVKSNM
ncbi:MAG: AraC family transcriptional regulator [Halobacteriovoraceae bacterium]|nr:AraC family transcriptional regulator [Halobacteriovoraceae bacterium]